MTTATRTRKTTAPAPVADAPVIAPVPAEEAAPVQANGLSSRFKTVAKPVSVRSSSAEFDEEMIDAMRHSFQTGEWLAVALTEIPSTKIKGVVTAPNQSIAEGFLRRHVEELSKRDGKPLGISVAKIDADNDVPFRVQTRKVVSDGESRKPREVKIRKGETAEAFAIRNSEYREKVAKWEASKASA